MGTRTYTIFFGDEPGSGIEALKDIHKGMLEDWTKRTRWMNEDVALAGHRRLQSLLTSIELLGERVAE